MSFARSGDCLTGYLSNMLIFLLGIFVTVWVLGVLGTGVGMLLGFISLFIKPPAPRRIR